MEPDWPHTYTQIVLGHTATRPDSYVLSIWIALCLHWTLKHDLEILPDE